MRTKNTAGFIFVWPDGSRFVEVYYPGVSYSDQPIEAVDMGGLQHSDSNLKKLANGTPEYAITWGLA